MTQSRHHLHRHLELGGPAPVPYIPLRRKFDEKEFCDLANSVTVLVWIGCAITIAWIPQLPSISVESISITVIDIPSTGTNHQQVTTANLEMAFLVENQNHNYSIAYDHINVLAFHRQKIHKIFHGENIHEIYDDIKLISDTTVAPIEQDNGTIIIKAQMDGVAFDHLVMYDRRSWISFLEFQLMTRVRMIEGTWTKSTGDMTAVCKISKIVISPNETRKIDFQPPSICFVPAYVLLMEAGEALFFLW
ncbi:uncharacterized protein LOC125423119 [Ziziphus jujuba]|uniref:Uncharacterized protein LOC125423119 n=1 Tax=Ziziphus jujuba TaxID=326968 RepID=A0ABM3IP75_ZIZJJ|nr:uncharacterized protein LOC125423119 [Ziziphus jujuba]